MDFALENRWTQRCYRPCGEMESRLTTTAIAFNQEIVGLRPTSVIIFLPSPITLLVFLLTKVPAYPLASRETADTQRPTEREPSVTRKISLRSPTSSEENLQPTLKNL